MNITDHEQIEPYYQDLNHILLIINAWDIGRSFTANLPEM